ncbi:acyl-CoA dehydrogenase C-terminal domain-containing protein [Psychrosphaera ytuae]|uniref:3-methylmercaptopropionyl-CoA dehydrogenase n=1 Tax=Psychrosphaera ytuae TaxID=2820710 RepID=A0A975HH90_9GAMM|nr:acyl-CoA dehydrogenase C-terminal domain-containing protein [Psychrosphaera ytuae]QTH62850.1 acyl-CoA dehydrogenase C-terminal domain-containing protein [Psychrosphaera ytuae]
MSQYNAPLNDMNFILFDTFKVQEFWQENAHLSESIDVDTAMAILAESAKVTEEAIAPFSRAADEEGVKFDSGDVTTPASYKDSYNVVAEGGWIGLAGNPEFGGMGMPKSITAMHEEMMCSADLAFALYPGLTAGACLAINAHASEELKELYLPNMYSGQWTGSMCLTEAHAGTDLGLIKTKAVPNDCGSYDITGSKIFISGGEHDLTENIIHLVLAKLPDAPEGSRGISLFLVPKINVDAQGNLQEPNAVSCGSIEHKMGIHTSATCVINFDGAKGYLVGEVNKGLAAMFTMMNYERLLVGLQGLGAAERSYQNAKLYAMDRGQGKGVERMTDKDCDPIVVHPDVRRMLLNMRAMNEAARAFGTYVSIQLDVAKFSDDKEQAKLADAKAQLLTPIAKAFVTDTSLEGCIAGQQVLGGHGYVREWGQEQLVRDCRITQIYEGTNGIQALDLMGRKVAMDKGATLNSIIDEIKAFASDNNSVNASLMSELNKAADLLKETADTVLAEAATDKNAIGAASVDFLHLAGYVLYAYMWAKMVVAAESLEGNEALAESKKLTANYYFARLLPRIHSLKAQIESGAELLYTFSAEQV